MIDLELERKAFEELSYKNGVRNFTKDDLDGGYCSAELDYNWHIWIKSAESKQAEIDSLKAQLAKIESGEFVVVPKSSITQFWQDDEEPENFVSKESDFDCLGDCIDIDDIMQINKHHQAHIQTEKLHGTWIAKDDGGGMLVKDSFYVGTKSECEFIVAKNKAMIEAAQENSHE
ncbi:hypothetical protein QE380_000153 [Acinetobacter baylyi]|uniref:Uncharacterized protein n=1 Tax=Acinetobacter baylyi TaxID=202950 RepID=A0ABU0URQ7_ACIBI|nr:hypothetical protein [Acinetobacter baylyi]MDQ1207230.1 hypothetical protein [Acinetobacter baylyi]MDR6105688.1 hypothetical protein [Acinetobacter baylyi]MDR6187592.1 hypothetical protein [Acinetobacter baylyi]